MAARPIAHAEAFPAPVSLRSTPGRRARLTSTRAGGSTTVRIKPAMSTNDGAVMRSWALDGLGVIIRSEWDLADDLAAGRLVRILADWRCPDADVVALLNPRHGRSRRTTAILELLRRRLHPVPWRMSSP